MGQVSDFDLSSKSNGKTLKYFKQGFEEDDMIIILIKNDHSGYNMKDALEGGPSILGSRLGDSSGETMVD